MSSTPTRVAVVGAGGIAAGAHLPALAAQRDRVEVVAIVDVDESRARQLAQEWRVPAFYTSVESMLAAESPALVSVCTPPSSHHDTVIACLEAGAWVWCEKPAALSLAEYDDAAKHEHEGGPYVAYVAQHRFGSAVRHLAEQVGSGVLGRPLVAVCNTLWYRDRSYYDVPWRGRWATEGGGPTMGHGIHQMDLLLTVLGPWAEVTALTGTLDRDVETEDVSIAAARFENGAMATVVNSVLSPREESYLRFDLTDATVEVSHLYGYDNSSWTWTPTANASAAARAAAGPPDEDLPSSHPAQLAALLDTLGEGRRPAVSGDDGRYTLEFIAAIYASSARRRPIRRGEIGPDDPFYLSMAGVGAGDSTAAGAAGPGGAK